MAELLERRKAVARFVLPDSGYVEHCTISSDILAVDKEFSVYLPAGYDTSTRQYPVLYLLHPAGGTHQSWISMGLVPQIADDAIRSGMALPMIIVMPDASGSDESHLGKNLGFFNVPGWNYESFFHTEFIPLIDKTYRTIEDKNHRVITGASMAGEAAVAYALHNPDIYGAACSLSGILGHPEQSVMARTDKNYADSLIANDPSVFVKNASPQQADKLKSVRWYVDCGDNDYFYQGNIDFFLAMKQKGVAIDFRIRSGVHGWYYWVTGLAPILHFLSIGFNAFP